VGEKRSYSSAGHDPKNIPLRLNRGLYSLVQNEALATNCSVNSVLNAVVAEHYGVPGLLLPPSTSEYEKALKALEGE
jgi:hypothetical protein